MNLSDTSRVSAVAPCRLSSRFAKPRADSAFRVVNEATAPRSGAEQSSGGDDNASRCGTTGSAPPAQPAVSPLFAAQVIGQMLGSSRLNPRDAAQRYEATLTPAAIASLTI
jgi:hypothetical protein